MSNQYFHPERALTLDQLIEELQALKASGTPGDTPVWAELDYTEVRSAEYAHPWDNPEFPKHVVLG